MGVPEQICLEKFKIDLLGENGCTNHKEIPNLMYLKVKMEKHFPSSHLDGCTRHIAM